MKETYINTPSGRIRVYTVNTAVVGTGAAGYNAADCLYEYGQHDIAIVTEHVRAGTSRNTGSDKQTYYKLTLSGSTPDSVREMAQTLFNGQCVDGDTALCEAALSVQGFMKLVELGVPFPRNRWGEYVGYKTDHDPRSRAASVGPYTSKIMTECLERSVSAKKIPVLDHLLVIKILKAQGRCRGLLCLDLEHQEDPENRFAAVCCENVIYATGGPAGMYADSVYPAGHFGASGLAFEAGAKGQNLTEWQFGLASLNPRWNVSGTYMQVLPRFISCERDGSGEREFLEDFFCDDSTMLTNIFLKGYQWPFDVSKAAGGSSVIDLLVYMETCKGRKVYLDFRENPGGKKEIDYSALSREAQDYLKKAGACFGTPYERLMHMNEPAVKFYRDRGVDLSSQALEIALCAQHNNGGIAVDCWWQTAVPHLFAVGEAAGTHGVYRPGGSALNAGQTGSARAARYIAARCTDTPQEDDSFREAVEQAVSEMSAIAGSALADGGADVREVWERAERRMSQCAGAVRIPREITEAVQAVKRQLDTFKEDASSLVHIGRPGQLGWVYRLRDMLISQYVYLNAMADYVEHGGKSRGSSLYSDPGGSLPSEKLPELFRFLPDDRTRGDQVQEILYTGKGCEAHWRHVREIPEEDDFFENTWRTFRENGNIY